MSGDWKPDDVEFLTTRKVLEQRKIGVTIRQSMHVHVDHDQIRQELQHRLEGYVLADHIADDTFTGVTSSAWPATTWQMFKQRHAASWWIGWFVRRRPIRMQVDRQTVEIRVERYLNYPEAAIVLQQLGRPVIFEQPRQVQP